MLEDALSKGLEDVDFPKIDVDVTFDSTFVGTSPGDSSESIFEVRGSRRSPS